MNDENTRLMLEQMHQMHQQTHILLEKHIELNLQFFNYRYAGKPAPQTVPDVVASMAENMGQNTEEEEEQDTGISGGVN